MFVVTFVTFDVCCSVVDGFVFHGRGLLSPGCCASLVVSCSVVGGFCCSVVDDFDSVGSVPVSLPCSVWVRLNCLIFVDAFAFAGDALLAHCPVVRAFRLVVSLCLQFVSSKDTSLTGRRGTGFQLLATDISYLTVLLATCFVQEARNSFSVSYLAQMSACYARWLD